MESAWTTLVPCVARTFSTDCAEVFKLCAEGNFLMNQCITAILIASAGLSACQATTPGPLPTAVAQEDLSRLKAERDARRITYTEWAERTRAAAKSSAPLSAEQEAAMAYRTELARRVDAGDLTPAEFDDETARTLQRLKAGRTRS